MGEDVTYPLIGCGPILGSSTIWTCSLGAISSLILSKVMDVKLIIESNQGRCFSAISYQPNFADDLRVRNRYPRGVEKKE